VNRVPSGDPPEVRAELGAAYPEGDYLCAECEAEFDSEPETE